MQSLYRLYPSNASCARRPRPKTPVFSICLSASKPLGCSAAICGRTSLAVKGPTVSNYAWVCFLCRSAARRPGDATDVRCRSCGKSCECIGYKTPIPPKSKLQEWEALRRLYYCKKQQGLARRTRDRVRRIHSLEKEILRLESVPSNPGRTKAVKLMKKRLKALLDR